MRRLRDDDGGLKNVFTNTQKGSFFLKVTSGAGNRCIHNMRHYYLHGSSQDGWQSLEDAR